MFGINRLKTQIEELQKEVSRLVENQTYYERGSTAPRLPLYFLGPDNQSEYASWWNGAGCPQSPQFPCHGKSLAARDILNRFDELYAALNLERKTIPGTSTTVRLEKKKP